MYVLSHKLFVSTKAETAFVYAFLTKQAAREAKKFFEENGHKAVYFFDSPKIEERIEKAKTASK